MITKTVLNINQLPNNAPKSLRYRYHRKNSWRFFIVAMISILNGTYKNILYKRLHCIRGESHIDFRTQCVIMTQTRLPPSTPCQMPHFQNFEKIDSFLKPVLNILILGKLIVGWGEGVIKRGLVFCIKSIDLRRW